MAHPLVTIVLCNKLSADRHGGVYTTPYPLETVMLPSHYEPVHLSCNCVMHPYMLCTSGVVCGSSNHTQVLAHT